MTADPKTAEEIAREIERRFCYEIAKTVDRCLYRGFEDEVVAAYADAYAARIRSERSAAQVRQTLFAAEPFKSHSGAMLPWKIEADALTNDDWQGLAIIAIETLLLGSNPMPSIAIGIPHGGLKLAATIEARRCWTSVNILTGETGPRLIVDDVLATGKSMREAMTRPDDIGLVVFARGPLPPRVTALFMMPDAAQAEANRRVAEAIEACLSKGF